MNCVTMYATGSCLNNGKLTSRGGWAAILTKNGQEKVVSGNAGGTKSNRVSLFAVIEGVRALKAPCEITVVTNSKYVINTTDSLRGWAEANKKEHQGKKLAEYISNWTTASGAVPANIDLVNELVTVLKQGGHHATFRWQNEGDCLRKASKLAHNEALKLSEIDESPIDKSMTYEEALAKLMKEEHGHG